MPSASSQSSMQITAQMENNDLTKSVLSLLEKKVRNLEKRKGKLDGYKKLVDAGQSLNDDQKVRLSKANFSSLGIVAMSRVRQSSCPISIEVARCALE